MVVADGEAQTECSKNTTDSRFEGIRRIGDVIPRVKATVNV